jgi:hypothetical protein
LIKAIIPLYIICLVLYIFFTRQPDYQDGEFTTGVIHYVTNSNKKILPKAIFTAYNSKDTIDAYYPLRRLREGSHVRIIYDTSNTRKASVYSWWGYWLKWDELLASILIPFILLYAAKEITARPTAEGLIEELEMRDQQKRKNNEV